MALRNHYKVLGVNSSASHDEIRRAYRILARRYHPDVNPGKDSEERFKDISIAYDVLSDPEKRRQFDIELENHQRARLHTDGSQQYFRRFQQARQRSSPAAQRRTSYREPRTPKEPPEKAPVIIDLKAIRSFLTRVSGWLRRPIYFFKKPRTSGAEKGAVSVTKISVIEVSVTIHDAIAGVKKTIEIMEPGRSRKISVLIPPGARTGNVLRLRAKDDPNEEVVLIVRVASHPFLSMQAKGLVAEIPISVNEAISGASITVPTLDEPVVVKIMPGSQSGSEVRLRGKGIADKDGTRGDLFIRFLIKVPESSNAVGIKEKAGELDLYYEEPVRRGLPRTLLEF